MKNDPNLYPLQDIREQIRKRRYRLATRQGYLELAKSICMIAVILAIAFTQIFCLMAVSGTDMYPAILDGDILLGYRLDRTYLKNDVVICNVNGNRTIGRIVARGGDSVDITEDGRLFVNGTEQTGEIAFPTSQGMQEYPYIVPEECVYLLGDYRTQAIDSRMFGAVPISNISAKVVSVFRRRGI